MVPEAPLRETKHGLVADVDGWFVLNARDSRWRDYGPLGFFCNFEGKRPFRQLGFNINILEPGQVLGRYHRENAQEAFLVVAGTCLLIVEDEERELKTWDFFHCPPQTEHVIIGAGEGPAVVVAVGARGTRAQGARLSRVGGCAEAWRRGRDRDDEAWRGLRRLPLQPVRLPRRLAALS